MTRLKHLFEPVKIGPMNVRNRVLMSGMTLNFGTLVAAIAAGYDAGRQI